MTAEELLSELAERLENPVESNAEWEELVLRLGQWRQEAMREERSAWKRKILDADEQAETLNEKGEALMALAEAIRRGG